MSEQKRPDFLPDESAIDTDEIEAQADAVREAGERQRWLMDPKGVERERLQALVGATYRAGLVAGILTRDPRVNVSLGPDPASNEFVVHIGGAGVTNEIVAKVTVEMHEEPF